MNSGDFLPTVVALVVAIGLRVLLHESWHFLARTALRVPSSIWIPPKQSTSPTHKRLHLGPIHIGWPPYAYGITEPWPLPAPELTRLGPKRVAAIALAAPVGMLLSAAVALEAGLYWSTIRQPCSAAAFIWLIDSGGNLLPDPRLVLETPHSKEWFDTTDGGIVSAMLPDAGVRITLIVSGYAVMATAMFVLLTALGLIPI